MVNTMMTTWMPTSHGDYDLLKGKDVYSVDGEKVGTVTQIYHPEGNFGVTRGRHFFLLDPGILKDWFGGFDQVYLPETAITNVTQDRIEVSFSKDQIKGQGWTTKPADFDRYSWS